MVTAVTAATVPVPVNVLAGEQPVNGVLEIGLGTASGLHQCDASGCMRNKDMTQAVAAVAAELKDHFSDIGDKTGSGTYLKDIGMHFPIISGKVLRPSSAGAEEMLHGKPLDTGESVALGARAVQAVVLEGRAVGEQLLVRLAVGESRAAHNARSPGLDLHHAEWRAPRERDP